MAIGAGSFIFEPTTLLTCCHRRYLYVLVPGGGGGTGLLSSSRQFRRRPDNYRSLMVICPCGFASLMRSYWISCGRYIFRRNGVNFFIPIPILLLSLACILHYNRCMKVIIVLVGELK